MVEMNTELEMSDVIWENSPANGKNKSFYGVYPFKLWTLACIFKHVYKMDRVNRADFYMAANNWIPRSKPIVTGESCG